MESQEEGTFWRMMAISTKVSGLVVSGAEKERTFEQTVRSTKEVGDRI